MRKQKNKNKIIENFEYLLNELRLIDKAEDLAQQVHMRQKRKGNGKPYIVHPKRVQLLAKELGYEEEIQIAALLHDAIEDTSDNKKQIVYNYIKNLFGSEVLNIIMLLTHEKSMNYERYLYKLATSSSTAAKKAFQVKMLDMYDNLSDNPTPSQRQKYYNSIEFLRSEELGEEIPDKILNLLQLESITEADKEPADTSKTKDSSPSEKDSGSTSSEPASDTKSPSEPVKSGGGDNNEPKTEPASDSGGGGLADLEEPGAGGADAGADAGADGGADAGGDPGAGGDMGDMGDGTGDGVEDAPEDAGEDVGKYTDETNGIQGIKSQDSTPEPGFDFEADNQFYNDKYIGTTSKGSLIIGTPKIVDNQSKDLNFIKKNVIPKIDKIANYAKANNKKIVLMGETGLPYENGKFKQDEQGLIAKYLTKKYKDIGFDYWGQKDYNSMKADTRTFDNLKSKTKSEDVDINATLYLYSVLFNGRNEKAEVADGVTSKLEELGFPSAGLNDNKEILKFLYPETNSNIQNKASFILKSYLHLMEVNLMKKVIGHENKGHIVIVPADKGIAWKLSNSFKDIYKKSDTNTNSTNNGKETKK